MENPPQDPHDEAVHRAKPSRRIVILTVAPLVALTIAANIGNRIYFSIVDSQPLLTLILNPTNLVMATTAPKLSAAVFFTSVIVRRLVADPLYFMLGRWYGDNAIRWLKKRSPDLGTLAAKLEEWFPRYGRLLAFFYPHPLVILLAGSSAMRLRTFMFYDFLGTVAIAYVVWEFGGLAEKQITGFTGFLGDNQLAFGILSAVLLVFYFWSFRKQDNSMTGIDELEKDSRNDRDDDRPA